MSYVSIPACGRVFEEWGRAFFDNREKGRFSYDEIRSAVQEDDNI